VGFAPAATPIVGRLISAPRELIDGSINKVCESFYDTLIYTKLGDILRAGGCAPRHDRSRESRGEKPRGDDSVADGSPRDRATGRSRARVEPRPADLGRASPTTDGSRPGSLCVGKPRRLPRGRCHLPVSSAYTFRCTRGGTLIIDEVLVYLPQALVVRLDSWIPPTIGI
jgi:hypothetical protein